MYFSNDSPDSSDIDFNLKHCVGGKNIRTRLQLTIGKCGERHGNLRLLKLNLSKKQQNRKEELPCLREIIASR